MWRDLLRSTIRFGFALAIDCILVADSIKFLGRTNLSVSADSEARVHVLAGSGTRISSYLAFMTPFDSRRWRAQTCWGGGDFAADRHRPDRAVCRKARGCSVFPPRAATVFARYVARAQSRITVDGEP